jgi:hypothetical protein
MEADLSDLARVCQLLNEHEVAYLVVGGQAMGLHGVVRTTKDVDVLVPKDLENFEKLLEALSGLPWRQAQEIPAEIAVKKPFTIIGDDPRVDILTVAQGLRFEDMAARSCSATIDDVLIPFVSLADLMHMKQTDRLRDQADLLELRRIQQLREDSPSD